MKKIPKKVLLVIFILLLILVLGLVIKLISLKVSSKTKEKADIVVPIEKDKLNIDFRVEAKKLKNNEMYYVIRIINYRNKKVAKKDVKYKMGFICNDDTKLELFKEKDKKNLLNSKNEVKLKVAGKKKENTLYKLHIKTKDVNNVNIDVNIDS
ncbi:MAG: hypothetical protein IKG58_01535 [Bacilli bacterium]|nr:hypothetical protein [Bacilli bacterium]